MKLGLATCAVALSSLVSTVYASPLLSSKPHPVVIWHGLGDSAFAPGLTEFAEDLKSAFPGLYVHLIALEQDAASDQRAGFFGNVDEQVAFAAAQVAGVPELADGFDAVGFSQGGQFLRGYVERYNDPPVRNLVTFGSQHAGVQDLPACAPMNFLCRAAEGILRSGVYSDYAQSHVVSAQYFRNPRDYVGFQKYLKRGAFLNDINNEVKINKTYAANLAKLENFVMIMFDEDHTVQPKQSSWFASSPIANKTKSANDLPEKEPIPLRQSAIYTEDRIGLKKLDKRGALLLELCTGVHMSIGPECQMKVFGRYVGTPATILAAPVQRAWARLLYGLTGLRAGSMLAVDQLSICLLGIALITIAARISVHLVNKSGLLARKQGAIRLD